MGNAEIMSDKTLTIIVIKHHGNACCDALETIDSINGQTFTDHETVFVDDENSALEYSAKSVQGRFVVFIKAGDIFGSQMTLEENIRILKENENTDIVFFPWGDTRNGWPWTYDAHPTIHATSDADKAGKAIKCITCCKLYGKIYRRELFQDLNQDEFGRSDPEFMSTLIFRANDICWSPYGLYFYNGTNDDYMDDFRFIYDLLLKLYDRTGKGSTVFANCFFVVLNRMIGLMADYNLAFNEESAWLGSNVPGIKCLFHHMRSRDKQDLLSIKTLTYTNFVKQKVKNYNPQVNCQYHFLRLK